MENYYKNMKITNKLNKKMKAAVEIEISEPSITKTELANRVGVHINTITNWVNSPSYLNYRDQRLKEEWHDALKEAQSKMFDLMRNGKDDVAYRAAQYILDSNGYNATQKIEASVDTEIKVTLDD